MTSIQQAALNQCPRVGEFAFVGVRRQTIHALLRAGLIRFVRANVYQQPHAISGHFGRIRHTRQITCRECYYELTAAGVDAVSN